jgi:hypothetical protein
MDVGAVKAPTTTNGFDIAKSVFQVHGVEAGRSGDQDNPLEHFPFSVNRRDSQRVANKILSPSRAEEAGNGVFERFTNSSDPGC